ncbi:MAG TPA: DUF3108 domain-containing protein, partial [Nitrospiria bacterium]|nr:DUF3108 domain-containing protein [Nitrospiria bacterium]
FAIDWIGVNAGTAVMEVRPAIVLGENRVYPIVSIARSNDFISRFFPVEDRIETYMDTEKLLPVEIKIHQREGDRTKNRQVSYDRKNKKAVQLEEGKEERFDMDPSAQDALSVLYFFRNMKFPAEGATTVIKVFEGDKNWDLEIKMLGKESVETPAGNFNAVKVIVMAKYEGLFLNKGDITIWFADDKKHTPVQMRSRVTIGSVTVRLISMESPAETFENTPAK